MAAAEGAAAPTSAAAVAAQGSNEVYMYAELAMLMLFIVVGIQFIITKGSKFVMPKR